MIRTCVDSDVLVWSFRAEEPYSSLARSILDDPEREFVSSIFVRMETQAKALFNKRYDESKYYEEFFARVVGLVDVNETLIELAYAECFTTGVNALDGLHLVSAHNLGVIEFVTGERSSKSIDRTKLVKIIGLRD